MPVCRSVERRNFIPQLRWNGCHFNSIQTKRAVNSFDDVCDSPDAEQNEIIFHVFQPRQSWFPAAARCARCTLEFTLRPSDKDPNGMSCLCIAYSLLLCDTDSLMVKPPKPHSVNFVKPLRVVTSSGSSVTSEWIHWIHMNVLKIRRIHTINTTRSSFVTNLFRNGWAKLSRPIQRSNYFVLKTIEMGEPQTKLNHNWLRIHCGDNTRIILWWSIRKPSRTHMNDFAGNWWWWWTERMHHFCKLLLLLSKLCAVFFLLS